MTEQDERSIYIDHLRPYADAACAKVETMLQDITTCDPMYIVFTEKESEALMDALRGAFHVDCSKVFTQRGGLRYVKTHLTTTRDTELLAGILFYDSLAAFQEGETFVLPLSRAWTLPIALLNPGMALRGYNRLVVPDLHIYEGDEDV
jgi:hypothetical protein